MFIIENLFAQTKLFGFLSATLFYIFLGLGLLLVPYCLSSKVYNACKPLYLIAGVYVLYEFTLGYPTISSDTLLYVLSKVVVMAIVIAGVTSNFSFYFSKSSRLFSFIITGVILYAILSGGLAEAGGGDQRMELGFTNSNTTSMMGTIALAQFLFFYKRMPWYVWASMLVCLIGILGGGSRNAILMAVVILVVRYGLTLRIVLVSLAMAFTVFYVLPRMGIKTVGVERMENTIEGKEGSNREVEREAAKIMIAQKPISGWGYRAQNVGKAAKLSVLGSHSGYLDHIKFMGYPFALLLFAAIWFYTLHYFRKLYPIRHAAVRFHISILLSLIVAAFFEAVWVGVHEIENTLFYMSMGILSMCILKIKRAY
ncbi:MAG: hypothetical protein IKR63_04075 [Alloprevotella sp.]|nr:hypothetical protein [Alloprevotella sp.]